MIKAVIFDMDGVIIDSEPIWYESMISVMKNVGVSIDYETCLKTNGVKIRDIINSYTEEYSWDFEKYPAELVSCMIEDKLVDFIKKKGAPIPGVTDAFKYLKTESVKTGLASSSDMKIIHAVLDKFNIREYFMHIQSGQHEKFGKPHPDIYLSTALKMNVKSSECIAVEDSAAGVKSAKSAGMMCVGFKSGENTNDLSEADSIIYDMNCLKDEFKRIFKCERGESNPHTERH